MEDRASDRVYYVISDLHIGGDEQLGRVDFLEELLAFLRKLESTAEPVELVINGDAFGLWEMTESVGPEKLDRLIENYPRLFEQLSKTGESITITLLPGNHDHELAAYDAFVERFGEYNVYLVQDPSITRPLGNRTIHFEHGQQQDPNNRIEEWGSPYARPLGYYLNTEVTSKAGKLSSRGRYNWLKDLQAVTPTERIPRWLISKYFYREMNPLLRYALVPFLLLFNVSAIVAVLAGLHLLGIWTAPIELSTAFLGQFGTVGTAMWFLLALNVSVVGLLLLLAIPVYFLRRDVRKTIDRFGVFETDLTVDPVGPYLTAARETFDERPETVAYCYGHTHRASLHRVDGRLLINSGTWLKRLHRRESVAGILPPIFYPAYQLAAVRIARQGGTVTVEFEEFEKPTPAPEELTLTERLLTLGRTPEPTVPEPASIELDSDVAPGETGR